MKIRIFGVLGYKSTLVSLLLQRQKEHFLCNGSDHLTHYTVC